MVQKTKNFFETSDILIYIIKSFQNLLPQKTFLKEQRAKRPKSLTVKKTAVGDGCLDRQLGEFSMKPSTTYYLYFLLLANIFRISLRTSSMTYFYFGNSHFSYSSLQVPQMPMIFSTATLI